MADPFNIEIIGAINYEPNPANPSEPQKNVEISKFDKKWEWNFWYSPDNGSCTKTKGLI